MRWVEHADAGAFVARAEPFLRRAEAEHNMLLGYAAEAADGALRLTAEDGGRVIGCALHLPGLPLMLTGLPVACARRLAAELAVGEVGQGSAIGPLETVDAFAVAWGEHSGLDVRRGQRMRLHRLDRLEPPRRPPAGELEWGTAADREPVEAWLRAFAADTAAAMPAPEVLAERMTRDHAVAFWTLDGRRRAMAAFTARRRRCARVSYVYTPPEERGHGYATAVVHGLCAALLADAVEILVLYTDLDNPTSNRIYAALGFRGIQDLAEWRWGEVAPAAD